MNNKKITMIKKLLPIFAVACLFSACTPASDQPEEQKQEEIELDPFTATVTLPEDHIFNTGKPSFTLHLTNPNAVSATAEVMVNFKTDKGKKTDYDFQAGRFTLAAGETKDIGVDASQAMTPGFYTVSFQSNGTILSGTAQKIGIDPFHIDSPADKQEDFDTFWADAYPTGWDAKYLSYFKSYIK